MHPTKIFNACICMISISLFLLSIFFKQIKGQRYTNIGYGCPCYGIDNFHFLVSSLLFVYPL
nr:MAG TPA: hypothetical protein [Caudoviricetes sp.]